MPSGNGPRNGLSNHQARRLFKKVNAMPCPADLRECLPENHSVHFIIVVAGHPDISAFKANASGSKQYPFAVMGYPRKRAGNVIAVLLRDRVGDRSGNIYERDGTVYMWERGAS
jgi:hypothetical protein